MEINCEVCASTRTPISDLPHPSPNASERERTRKSTCKLPSLHRNSNQELIYYSICVYCIMTPGKRINYASYIFTGASLGRIASPYSRYARCKNVIMWSLRYYDWTTSSSKSKMILDIRSHFEALFLLNKNSYKYHMNFEHLLILLTLKHCMQKVNNQKRFLLIYIFLLYKNFEFERHVRNWIYDTLNISCGHSGDYTRSVTFLHL